MVKQIQSVQEREKPTLLPVPTRAEIEKAGIHVLLGIPLERTLNFKAVNGLAPIFQKGWSFLDLNYGRTDVARNLMARSLLDSPYTHLFMMDDDHIHMPDIVERHVRWVMDDPDKLVIGGLHFRRGEPYEPCAFVRAPDGTLHAPVEWEQGITEVDVLGHGTLLVSRKVFEQLTPPYWRYTYTDGEFDFPSEDMYFSDICRAAGMKLWLDTTATSQHLINGVVNEAVYRAFLADHPELATVERDEDGVFKPGKVTYPNIGTRVDL